MKTVFCIVCFILFFSNGNCQRYEIWVDASNNTKTTKGNFGLSNDTTLLLYTNSSLFFPTQDKYFTWDEVVNLKIRNKSKNQLGQLLGAGAGLLAFEMLRQSAKKSGDLEVVEFTSIITIPILVGTGTLIGHMATRKKTKLTLYGMSQKEKNETLKRNMKKRK